MLTSRIGYIISFLLISANGLPQQLPLLLNTNFKSIHALNQFPNYSLQVTQSITKEQRSQSDTLCDDVDQLFGYFSIKNGKLGERHLFFWLVESRTNPDTDDFVYWTNGGPGSSSILNGALMELGPCRVDPGGESTHKFKYSWNQKATLLFVDHPTGVGWSYSDNIINTPYSSKITANDIYILLQLLFTGYPKYAKLPFHAFGESYAGHYIPSIGMAIFNGNQEQKGPVTINLKSIGIGNGYTDPREQFPGYAEMACQSKYAPLVSGDVCDKMYASIPRCRQLMDLCYKYPAIGSVTCFPAGMYCDRELTDPYYATGRNPYDVRMICGEKGNPCYPQEADVEHWLNLESTKAYFGVNRTFSPGSDTVYRLFTASGDQGRPFVQEVQDLLRYGIATLIYVGDADWICNAPGQIDWMKRAFVGFLNAKEESWISSVTGREAGWYKEVPGLKLVYINIFESGHFVPADQPEHAQELINEWLDAVKKAQFKLNL